jgi:hypothetical protein
VFYDRANQLTQWIHYGSGIAAPSKGDLRTDFTYDGRSRLRKRLEYTWSIGGGAPIGPLVTGSWNLSTETHYVYDGYRVIQDQPSPRVACRERLASLEYCRPAVGRASPGYGLARRDGNNTPTVSYTRGSDLSGSLQGAGGIGGLLARSHGYSSGSFTNHNCYHADGNGNITYLVSSSQGLAASYRYDPFGNTISSSGTLATANLYRFSSKEIHANSGMYYYLYRFYDPNLQRWIIGIRLESVEESTFTVSHSTPLPISSTPRAWSCGEVSTPPVVGTTGLHSTRAELLVGRGRLRPLTIPPMDFAITCWEAAKQRSSARI